jgi:Putative Flp pilus-assembly TadE/G-like
MRARSDAGSITAMTATVVAGFVLMLALVVGGGAVLRARTDAFGTAAAAARAGAQQLDEDALAQGDVVIDIDQAEAAAQGYLAAQGADGTVQVAGADVVVTANETVAIPQLGQSVTISATATVSAIKGAAA